MKRKATGERFLLVAGILLIILIWTLLAFYLRQVKGRPFPYMWEAVMAIFSPSSGQENHILLHTFHSLSRWLTGYGIAVVAGISLGFATAASPRLATLLHPLIHTLQLIPGLAWVPIALILFGLGNASAIFMIAVTAFAPIVINTRSGIRHIEPNLLRAAQMMELGRIKTFSHLILPGAAPSIINGLRVASANGFRVLISAEMVLGSNLGLGYDLLQARWSFDYETAFGAVIIIVLIGLVVEKLIFSPIDDIISRKRGVA